MGLGLSIALRAAYNTDIKMSYSTFRRMHPQHLCYCTTVAIKRSLPREVTSERDGQNFSRVFFIQRQTKNTDLLKYINLTLTFGFKTHYKRHCIHIRLQIIHLSTCGSQRSQSLSHGTLEPCAPGLLTLTKISSTTCFFLDLAAHVI